LDLASGDALVTLMLGVSALVIALAAMPRQAVKRSERVALPWWDIPARMLVATVFVLALTSAAPALGSRLSGLLSPFPVYAAVLCVFAHRLQGAAAGIAGMRGPLLGLFGFAAVFAWLAFSLEPRRGAAALVSR